ncbi:PHP domain-containing protein [Microbacterium testaceum StLB037]|uniref:PHP domain-containing protein n=1 Tax=Microbacterium testaceum (strain StLB037) TaxID=979556 RepID=A0A1H0RWH5_MICTS|nr:PHP domain-containing protein [Microbacterium testaceum]SDP33366.1 PHP domain-containing protein [Microbacterium testaceum StLB037]
MPSHTPSGFSRRTFLAAAAAAVTTASAASSFGPAAAASAVAATTPTAVTDPKALRWLVFDHHVHSVYSHDAKYAMTTILDQAQRFGVDAIAFTEHSNVGHANVGGVFNAAREIEAARTARPDLLVFQGLEWYIPAAEHGTVLVAPGPRVTEVLRNFELTYDGKLNQWEKPRPNTSDAADWLQHAVDGISWLGQQRKVGLVDDVLVLANHPSRLGIDSPGELRAWQDADPDVFVGFEGAPGAQASGLAANTTDRSQRGEYENSRSDYSFPGFPASAYRAHGGFDWMTAVVGGMWDALLSEGRRWWITTNSDLHLKNFDNTRVGDFPTGSGWDNGATLANFNRAGRRPDPVSTASPQGGSDLWPGEFSRTHVGAADKTHTAVLDAVRAGRMWVDHGHLVAGLAVTLRAADDTANTATLGGTLRVPTGTKIEIVIDVEPTTERNSAGILPRLAHLDVIRGEITGAASDRDTMVAPRTRVIELRDVSDRSGSAFQIVIPVGTADVDGYVRVRGSDGKVHGTGPRGADVDPRAPQPHAAGQGNPWLDTWLYTNPIFVSVR